MLDGNERFTFKCPGCGYWFDAVPSHSWAAPPAIPDAQQTCAE